MPLPLSSSPLFPNNEDLQDLPLFDEAKEDLTYRFLDLEEALGALHEVINLLRQERDVSLLEGECKRLKQETEGTRSKLREQLENIASEDISTWLSQEFPRELDHLHQQICHVTQITYGVHHCWIDLPKQSLYQEPSESGEF